MSVILTTPTPSNVVASEVTPVVSPTSVTVKWNSSVGDYTVQRAPGGGMTLPWEIWGAVGISATEFSLFQTCDLPVHAPMDPDNHPFSVVLPATSGHHYAFKVRVAAIAGPQRFSPIYRVRTSGQDQDTKFSWTEIPDERIIDPSGQWSLETLDQHERYVFEMNPNKETSPVGQRALAWDYIPKVGPNGFYEPGGFSATRTGRAPVRYEISGVMRTAEQHKAMQYWLAKTEVVRLITDLGEVHYVRIIGYNPTLEAPGQGRKLTRRTYTLSCLLYDEIPFIMRTHRL